MHSLILCKMGIPLVDFSAYSLSKKDVPDEELQVLIKELKTAFMEVGFVYLKNTGITQEEVDNVMKISMEFFLQPDELKKPFRRTYFDKQPNHGWVPIEAERLNPQRPEDFKELFNVSSLHPDVKWPSAGALAGFQEIQTSYFNRCKDLSLRVLRLMALSLGIDPEVFLGAHRLIGTNGNSTTLRSLYYPPVSSEQMKANQLRCGEHADYGSITLLVQSPEGGLQVRDRSGKYVHVPTIPGAILVNIADLMQRWTSDQFVSTLHRVLLPPSGDFGTRQSVAFFVHPDDEALITCCDGSNKYPPITSYDHLMGRFQQSFSNIPEYTN
ncbi:2-oxoglutarate-dependent dioxygenase htyE [Thalassophryne amazonica]|uniref:2-oxoglutarate-dependent dioxygenase htyE n=1 Tax=Thalassophryne amazonica TaxID=390379 RepID=UPI001470A2AD|nr:2-oxoglutarate-dependent dioxygenase htyE [Thalassophryne amazonica]